MSSRNLQISDYLFKFGLGFGIEFEKTKLFNCIESYEKIFRHSKIRDLNNYVNWEIPEESSKTINGLITEYLDQIPQANLCIEIENYRFEILELDDNLISKIKIKKRS